MPRDRRDGAHREVGAHGKLTAAAALKAEVLCTDKPNMPVLVEVRWVRTAGVAPGPQHP